MAYSYIISRSDFANILLAVDGRPYTITESHPAFSQLVSALISEADQEEIVRLAEKDRIEGDRVRTILSERFSFDEATNTLYLDGDPLHTVLAEAVVKRLTDGYSDATPLLNFYEKLMQNPSERSREQLYTFLEKHGLRVNSEGNFLAYKGVNLNGFSLHSGDGIVDGKTYTDSQLPNTVGSVVEFPRTSVDDDPNAGCSVGLHAGSYEYAVNFAPMLLTVEINPRDVVSVPSDHNFAKLRVCRYKVLDIARHELTEMFFTEDWEEEESDNEDEDDYNGYYEDARANLITKLKELAAPYSRKGKVGDSYADIAEALGYEYTDEEYYVAETLDLDHPAGAVYRYHIDALEE